LCIMLSHVVGIPTISEITRLISLKIPLFNPNINLMLFEDGFSMNFIMNIMLFVPFGLLCPLISNSFRRMQHMLLAGFGLSFIIETTQLFTLYRISDINDLISNTAGTFIGYMLFVVLSKLKLAKPYAVRCADDKDLAAYIPFIAVILAFVLGFFCDFGFVY
ncbi:MAG TPA: VanZ family protein, partial [Candidatus Alectryocaccobium stercorigallinarum]|nr:VanZ family protein [Candidatus Alectryocaccobium stercorigallinarum]